MESLSTWAKDPWTSWGLVAWEGALRAHVATRAKAGRTADEAEPWELQPCPCYVEHETGLTAATYGHTRTLLWWLRSFTAAGGAAALPRRLSWPQHAQLAVPSESVRAHSRAFWRMNLALASAASPRNVKRPRAPGEDHGANCTAWKVALAKKAGRAVAKAFADRERAKANGVLSDSARQRKLAAQISKEVLALWTQVIPVIPALAFYALYVLGLDAPPGPATTP